MKRPPEIKINQFQLAVLLNGEQKKFFEMVIAENVFCSHCGGICKKGMTINEMFLTDLNDILVKGTCNICKGKVARTMEFGEEKEFYDKAIDFRNSIRDKT
jgi:hypothetical protein